jgi:hypothetical protein
MRTQGVQVTKQHQIDHHNNHYSPSTGTTSARRSCSTYSGLKS